MRLFIATPAGSGSLSGNRRTALRYAGILRSLGHRVRIGTRWRGEPADVLVALHAVKSAASVLAFRAAKPRAPIVLVLTGTDLYGRMSSARARAALAAADRVVVLQPAGLQAVPASVRRRAVAILQSAPSRGRRRRNRARRNGELFQACVLAHLRPVKDPLLAARAARRLPEESALRIVHAGAALTPGLAARARAEERANPRYRWAGPLPHPRALSLLDRSHVLVQTSISEGGSIAVAEAVAARVPVIASRIPGAVGMLGRSHPGLFRPRDAEGLARLLRRAETDRRYYSRLLRAGNELAPRFNPRRERAAWRELLVGLLAEGVGAARGRAHGN